MLPENELDELDQHKFAVVVWIFGRAEDLKDAGLLEIGGSHITPRGVHVYDQLKASGFKPTTEEIRSLISYLMPEEDEKTIDDLVTLFDKDEQPCDAA
jgi:hypothetical protein